MRWIGQHIWDFISRFRNDVYLEDLTESAQNHVVGIDSSGKLYKQDVSSGDITSVIGGNNIDVTGGTSGAATVNLKNNLDEMKIIQGINVGGGETETQETTVTLRSFKHLHLEFDADDTDTDGTLEFMANGVSVGTLDQDGNLILRGALKSQNSNGTSHFPSKGSSGNILVDDSGEIKTRAVSDLKGDLGLAKADVGLGSAENKSSSTIRGEIVSGNIPNNAADTSGNSATATKLAATKTINGVAFDGSSNITVTAAGSTLSDVVTIANGGTAANNVVGARASLGVDAAGTDNSTDVTLTGTPNYITISGQEITRNQIDLTADVTGVLPSDKVKQICTTHHNFFMNSPSTSADFFVPFNNLNESSTPTNVQYYNRMVAPYDGRIVKVVLHTTAAIGTSCQVLFWVATSAGVFAPSAAETVTGVNLNTANTSATATFSTSSTAQFSAEDVLGVSIIKSSSATANMQVTVVWEYTL